MTFFAVSLLKRWVQDLMHQALVLRTVCFMTTNTIRLVDGDSRVGNRHGRIIEIVTILAKAHSFACKQVFNICIVWHMAFQTHPFLCRRVLKFILFNIKCQAGVA